MTAKSGRHGDTSPASGGVVPATGLGLILREAYKAFSADFHARLGEYCITYAQWLHLWLLSRERQLTPVELSRRAGIKKASSTAVLNQLTARGLIRRVPDTLDRRRVNLSLTPEGRILMRSLVAAARISNRRARGGISDEEYAQMFSTLRKVIANLEATGPGETSEVVLRTTCEADRAVRHTERSGP